MLVTTDPAATAVTPEPPKVTEIGAMTEEALEPGKQPQAAAATIFDDDPFSIFEDTGEEAESPLETPAEKPADTTGQPAQQISEKDIAALVQKFGGNPAKLAQALLNAQKVVDKQGNELGKYRRTAPAPPTEEQVYAPPAGTPAPTTQQQPTPQAPAPVQGPTLTFEIPEESQLFRSGIDTVDTDTGWPVDEDGNLYQPHNELGIPYTNAERWEKRAEELAEEFADSPAKAALALVQEQQNEQVHIWQETARRQGELVNVQIHHGHQAAEGIYNDLAREYPPAVAQQLAQFFLEVSANGLTEYRKRTDAIPSVINSPTVLGQGAELAYFEAFRSGQLRQYADRVSAGMTPQGRQGVAPQQQASYAPPPTPTPGVPTGNNGTSSRASADEQRLLQSGMFKNKDELHALMAEDYKFSEEDGW